MKKLKVILGIIICVVIVAGIFFATNNSDSAIKKYCKIMVNGNYGDIIDIADLPDSEFITKEKKEDAKKAYFEKMKFSDEQAITCTYTKANENDATITYKLTINDSSTDTIDLNKKTGKLMIDGIYKTKTIITYVDCTVTLDGKEIKNPIKENSTWKYNAIVLSNVEYETKVIPRAGVPDEFINAKIKEESVDGKKIAIVDRKTDLENGTDTITFSSEYDDGILSSKGTFDNIYVFGSGYSWQFEKKENENIKDTWNIAGTWVRNTNTETETLILKEENGQIIGEFKYINNGYRAHESVANISGSKTNDGHIELSGKYKNSMDSEAVDCNFIATIDSKEKQLTYSFSNFSGTYTLTKQD